MTNRIDLTVVGDDKMHCSGCETRVGFALQRLPGVQHVTADAKNQRISVAFDPAAVTTDQVLQRIKDLGFEAEVSS